MISILHADALRSVEVPMDRTQRFFDGEVALVKCVYEERMHLSDRADDIQFFQLVRA